MREKVLGFDLDGTLYDWHSLIYEELRSEHKIKENYFNFWRDEWRRVPQQVLDNLVNDISFYGRSIILPEIHDMLWYLDKFYDLVYITQRPITATLTTRLWLKKSRVPNADNVFVVDTKAPAVRISGCSFFIEDKAEQAHILKLFTKVILVEQPWNEGKRDGLTTIPTVLDVPKILEKLDKNYLVD